MQDLMLFLQHHWQLAIVFFALVALLTVIEALRAKLMTQQISPSQLTDLINHQNAVVIDLRPTDEFSKGHIIGALSIPKIELDKSKKLEKYKSRPLVLVCHKGLTARQSAAALVNKGYHVHILGGGIAAWMGADMPLVKE